MLDPLSCGHRGHERSLSPVVPPPAAVRQHERAGLGHCPQEDGRVAGPHQQGARTGEPNSVRSCAGGPASGVNGLARGRDADDHRCGDQGTHGSDRGRALSGAHPSWSV